MTIPAVVRVNANALFPAQVTGANGIAVTKSNGIWTLKDDFTSIAALGSLTSSNSTFKVYVPSTKTYGTVTAAQIVTAGLAAGTQNVVPKFGAAGAGLVNSLITDSGTAVGICATAAVSPDSLLTINGNTAAASVAPASVVSVHIVAPDAVGTAMLFDGYGGSGSITGNRADGTNAAKLPLAGADEVVFGFSASGWDGSTYGPMGNFQFRTAEAWSVGHHGSYIRFTTVAIASASVVEAGRFQPSGSLTVGAANGTTDKGAGAILCTDLYTNNTNFLARAATALANGAAANTATLTNAPAAGNPTKWISIDDAGTTRRIPAW